MKRRSISCMLAGLMIVTPIWLAYAADPQWRPHPWLITAIIAIGIVGMMWLYDEMTT